MKIKVIRTALAVIMALTLLFSDVFVAGASEIGVSASSAILIEAESGRVLYEKNADATRGMASTTKIMTALVALENGDLDSVVKIPRQAVGVEGSSLYLVENEELTLLELLYALMLRSANDAATAIAIHIGGSVDGFSGMMNARAMEMGLKNTHFENPHGLDGDGHYTTAFDLAIITSEALKNETFRKIVSTVSVTLSQNGVSGRRTVVNHNRLLRTYDGCIGVKTGFTKKCGRCLVSAAERNGVTLIVVTLNAPDDWQDHKRMLDYGFGICQRRKLTFSESGRATVVGGITDSVGYMSEGEAYVTVPNDAPQFRREVELDRFYYAPVRKGDILGRVAYYDGDTLVSQSPIVATEDAPQKRVGWLERLLIWIRGLFK